MEFFHELGSLVERLWRDRDYCEEVFPDIAEQALVETSPYRKVDPWDIIRWVNTATELPAQQDIDGIFGNPPVTLYSGPRFHIDVYYWLDGTTSIHQHAFAGAFQVLLGSSIHSQYSFEEERKINAHFSAGRITLNEVELLEEEAIRPILPGGKYIHSLFHLNRPSATIVIRTYRTPAAAPQYEYLKPYFAIDPFYKSPVMIKKIQSASLLLSMKHARADDLIGEILSCSDFQTAFSILNLAFNHLTNDQMEESFGLSVGQERFQSYIETARRRHGKLVDLVLPVFEEIQRQHHIIRRRSQITRNEHRFFLALLLNVPNREKILDLVKDRFPERNPLDTMTDWIDELANTKVWGSSEPNVLGIENFDDDYLLVFRCLLEGLSIEQIKTILEEEHAVEGAKEPKGNLENLCDTIRKSIIFKAILRDLPLAVPDSVTTG